MIGRPNVGKSSLLNRLVQRKISITSRKAQTTRHRILGIKTAGVVQMIYVDTPGLEPTPETPLAKTLHRTAWRAIRDVDVILFVADANHWTPQDDDIARMLLDRVSFVLVVLNKIDLLSDKKQLLPLLKRLSLKLPSAPLVPVSALKGTQVDLLEKLIADRLPHAPHLFGPSETTDRDDRFIVAEMIREKILDSIHQEVPYSVAVTVDSSSVKEKTLHLTATIWVERVGQKKILIGEKGTKLKGIGQQARLALERHFGQKVFLSLWVKVRPGWTEQETELKRLGVS